MTMLFSKNPKNFLFRMGERTRMNIHRQPFDQTTPAIKLIPWAKYQHKCVHVARAFRLAHICQNTAKGPCKSRGREEERNTVLPFTSLVPHRKIIHNWNLSC